MNGSSNRFKLITYDYDLISSKVNRVSYQPWSERAAITIAIIMMQRNRLVNVETSRDKIVWKEMRPIPIINMARWPAVNWDIYAYRALIMRIR